MNAYSDIYLQITKTVKDYSSRTRTLVSRIKTRTSITAEPGECVDLHIVRGSLRNLRGPESPDQAHSQTKPIGDAKC